MTKMTSVSLVGGTNEEEEDEVVFVDRVVSSNTPVTRRRVTGLQRSVSSLVPSRSSMMGPARATSIPSTTKPNHRTVVRWTCPNCDAEVRNGDRCDYCNTENNQQLKEKSTTTICQTCGSLTTIGSVCENCPRRTSSVKVFSKKARRTFDKADEEGVALPMTSRLKSKVHQRPRSGDDLNGSPLPNKRQKPVQVETQAWTEKYAPKSIEDLKAALDKSRVQSVQESLQLAINAQGPRLIVLHGPTGAGKSTCVKVIAQELGLRLREWDEETSSSTNHQLRSSQDNDDNPSSPLNHQLHLPYQRQVDLFAKFLSDCCYPSLTLRSSSSSCSAQHSTVTSQNDNGTVVLLESLPRSKVVSEGVNHQRGSFDFAESQDRLFQHVQRLTQTRSLRVCIVYILTVEGGSGASPTQIEEALGDQNASIARMIMFNSVAKSYILKTLGNVAAAEHLIGRTDKASLTSLADGDLRNAINNLQFLSLASNQSKSTKKKQKKKDRDGEDDPHPICEGDKTMSSALVRDTSFEMCYAVGKLLRGPKPAEPKFSPEAVARNCALEPAALSAFMYENFYKYASAGNCDVHAYSALMDNLSLADGITGHKWHVLNRSLESGGEDVDASDAFAESILARGASCWQRFVQGEIAFKSLVRVTKPQMFEAQREAQRVMNRTREYLRTRGDCTSAGLFVKDVLPFSVLITSSHDSLNQSRLAFHGLEQIASGVRRRALDEDDCMMFGDVSLFMEEEVEEVEDHLVRRSR